MAPRGAGTPRRGADQEAGEDAARPAPEDAPEAEAGIARARPSGLNHALVSFADPFTLDAWAGLAVEGLPNLGEQIRLIGEEVLPGLI